MSYTVNALFSAGPEGGPLYFGTPGEIATEIMATLNQFYKGDPGASTSAAQISTDIGNILTSGTDAKLLVPEDEFDYEALVSSNLPI